MGKPLVLFPLLGLVFVLGFVAGAVWQRSAPPAAVAETPGGVSNPVPNNLLPIPSSDTFDVSETETRINKALEDPDFKRVHDLLNREKPMQMNIPTRDPQPSKPVPMSERPAVKFSVDEP